MPERKWLMVGDSYPSSEFNIIKPVSCLVGNITSQGLASSFVLTHGISVLKVGAILHVAVWSLISERTANFKQRVTRLFFFFFFLPGLVW